MLWRNGLSNRKRYRPMWPSASMWHEMDRFHREMTDLLGGVTGSRAMRQTAAFPAVNVWENEGTAIISAELPGVDADSIEISVNGETLTLSGQRPVDELPESARYYRRERGHGEFNRQLTFPYRIDADNVSALFENGVLTVTVPRVPEAQPRKITVKS